MLADNSRAVRWAGTFFAICALILIPWTIVVAVTLPSRQLSPNYNLAWTGFDAFLFVALAATAWSALRGSRYVASIATCSAALLLTDAWFDVVTAPSGQDRLQAVVMACVIELPLAATCLWLAHRAHAITERQLRLLVTRRTGGKP